MALDSPVFAGWEMDYREWGGLRHLESAGFMRAVPQWANALGTKPSAQGRAAHFRLRPGASDYVCVELSQLFVGSRLDEPEAGNDAPTQAADHENPQGWQ